MHCLYVAPDSGQRDEPLVAELAEVALVANVLAGDARSFNAASAFLRCIFYLT